MTKKSIKGTKTEKNLVIAYMAESAAYTRYTFYASQANKEGYFPIERIFTETAANEMRHGKVFFKFLEGGNLNVPVDVDAGVIGDTASNLETAAHENSWRVSNSIPMPRKWPMKRDSPKLPSISVLSPRSRITTVAASNAI